MIPYITYETITNPILLNEIVYDDLSTTYYWSDDWSAELYTELAYCGFISVSDTIEIVEESLEEEIITVKNVLMPEIQEKYAVLDWQNLHISKKIRKLITKNYLKEHNFTITINQDIDSVLNGIAHSHGNINWISKNYIQVLHDIKKSSNLQRNISIISTELWNVENELLAGEIGYTIGQTYTSLSGFFKREKQYNHLGTIQLISLAKILQNANFAFWNMGHPYMQYKINLGAKILSRHDFLEKWKKYRDTNTTNPIDIKKYNCHDLLSN